MTTTFDRRAVSGGVFGRTADALIVERMNAKTLDEALPASCDLRGVT